MKESLILLPGVGSNHMLWQHQVEHLEDLVDAQVKVLYHAGGRAESVARLLKEAPERFALVGHSYGGWLAQAVATEAPQRVSKLMLFNTWTRYNEACVAMFRQWLGYIDEDESVFIEALDENLKYVVYPQRLHDQNFMNTLQDMKHKFPREGYRLQFQAMINDYETAPLLSKISCPTLVVHGREDWVFSLDEHQYLAHHVKNAKLTILEECGHMGPMEQPQAVTALMRLWLSV